MKQTSIGHYFTSLNAPEMGDELVMEFHEQTKWNDVNYCEFYRSFVTHLSDERALTEASKNWKNYFGCEQIRLPEPERNTATFREISARRRSHRSFTGDIFSLSEMSNILAGIRSNRREGPVNFPKITYHRTPYASGGGLYPVETYVLTATNAENTHFDLAYYNPTSHSLFKLKRGINRDLARLLINDADDEFVQDWNTLFFFTATFRRTMAKYGNSGYRMALIEVGEVAHQIALSLEACGFGGVFWNGIYDDKVNEFLGVDGRVETAILSLVAGKISE